MAVSVQQNHALSLLFRGGSVVHIMFFPAHESAYLLYKAIHAKQHIEFNHYLSFFSTAT